MITSAQNPKIQHVRDLLAHKKDRMASGEFVIEGVRLAEEASRSGLHPSLVLYTANLSDRGNKLLEDLRNRNTPVEEIAPHLMESISGTEVSQGILGVYPLPKQDLPKAIDFILVIDQLRDPGNFGTILRTAAAAGVQVVFLTPGVVDPYSPKVVRSAMGAHFRVPIISQKWEDIADQCQTRSQGKLQFYLAEAENGSPLWNIDFTEPTGLIIGGEAEGASDEGRALANGIVSVPMPGKFESLNAAVAASILVFEVVRQRNH